MVVVVVLLWLAVGALVGLVEARHGHWYRAWIVMAVFGPFAVPLALVAWRGSAVPEPEVLASGRAGPGGPLDVLAGIDGSAASLHAAGTACRLLGSRVRRLMLAAVVDFDTAAPHADSALHPEPWAEEREAREHLAHAAGTLSAPGRPVPGTVVLPGDPAHALQAYASAEGYDVIVVGCRGHGLSKLVLGSCASRLAREAAVPVLLIPGAAPVAAAGRVPAGERGAG